jgi:hypothetical protein
MTFKHVTRRHSRIPFVRHFFIFAALILVSGAWAARPAAARRRYRFSIGNDSTIVRSGSIWLYCYSWYGLQSLKLGSIDGGVAEVSLAVEAIKSELNPHINTDACVLVLQLPDNLWYRTPDISPERFWPHFAHVLDGLGHSVSLATGETLLILPKLARRQITLLHEDGRPVANAKVLVSIYLYDTNHCGVHTGLPIGTLVTNADGGFNLLAQSVPLYLDSMNYYQKVGSGPAGTAYQEIIGLKTGAEDDLVIRKAWAPGALSNQNDLPEQELELQILTPGDSPRAGVEIDETLRANTCGLNGSVGETDSTGTARIKVVPPVVATLELRRSNEKSRPLSEVELRELFSKKKLVVKW